MGHRGSDAAQLVQRIKALLTTISSMKSEHPLKPVWGGLPRGDQDGRIALPERPGFGIEFDPARVEKQTQAKWGQ